MTQRPMAVLIEVPSGQLRTVEAALRAQLPPQLDVALAPLTKRTALLRPHLVRAFQIAHPGRDLGEFLRSVGAKGRAIEPDQALARMQTRAAIELPARAIAPLPAVAGFDWHIKHCNVSDAWNLLGGPAQIPWTVRVGQLDTGYTQHPALGFGQGTPWLQVNESRTFVQPPDPNINAIMVQEPGGGIDPLTGVSAGHGTRMASTLSGFDAGAAGRAFYGVAPKVPLVMTRVCDWIVVSDKQPEMTDALRYLVSTAKVDVVNVSLGFLPPGATMSRLKQALSEAYDAGVIVVCAAGNYADTVVVPARLNRTLAVAGVTADDVPWSGSSYGAQVDMSAPANNLRRGDVARGKKQPTYSYAEGGDGTSYATAMTTGAAALWLQHRAGAIATRYTQRWQRVAAFRKLVRDHARVPTVAANGAPVWQPGSFGTGILDVRAVLEAQLPDPATLQAESQP